MWRTVKLGDVCDLQNGFAFKSSLFREKGLPILRISNIQNEEVSLDKLAYFVEEDYEISFERYKVLPNDLLIAMSGATTGKLGFNQSGQTLYLNQRVGKFEPKGCLDKKYLYYVLSTKVEENLSISKGAAQPNLSTQQIKDIEFPLPPLAEQQRIVAKLDAAFAEIDKAIELQKKRIESSVRIFENHLSEKFEKCADSWTKASLKEITTKIGSGATPKGGQASYKDDGISLIRSMNVHDLKMVDKDLAKIDDVQAAKLSNVSVEENDVLLNITGASVARCALVDRRILPARVNQHVAIIRLKKQCLNPKLLSYMLVSKLYKDKLLAVGEGGGSTRQAITKKQIEEFEITYPNSVEEQELLVTMLDDLAAQTQKLALIYRQQCQHTSALKNSILAQELHPSEVA